jgi:MoaA/NifB/PqqE/SkfB family radical SAM enzyme
MRLLPSVRHLRSIRSAPLRAVAQRALTMLPDLWRSDGRSSALVNISLEITYRCNLKCEFCYLKDELLNDRREELSLEEITSLVEQAKPYGASFYITGGEPFLRRDLFDVVSTIKSHGLRVGVNTNGILVDGRKGQLIRWAGLDYIIFSLHGPPDVHNELEGCPGAYERILANIEEFARKKGKTRVLVNCVVAKGNAERLGELPRALAHVPLDGITYQHESYLTESEVRNNEEVWKRLFPGRPQPLVYQSTGCGARNLGAMDAEIAAIVEGTRKGDWPYPVYFKPFLSDRKLRDWYTADMCVSGKCTYLWTDTRIEPDGTLNACQVMPTPMGNVRETPLAELLNNELYRDFRARILQAGGNFPACARCCKLYRNPMKFARREPRWQEWVEAAGGSDSPAR